MFEQKEGRHQVGIVSKFVVWIEGSWKT